MVQEPKRRRRATTPEARENRLVSLAMDLAEKQLEEGTASAMVLTHWMKVGSMREKLEREALIQENKLRAAKTEAYASGGRLEELYTNALDAMRSYGGHARQEYED